jgi:hypothetical protein
LARVIISHPPIRQTQQAGKEEHIFDTKRIIHGFAFLCRSGIPRMQATSRTVATLLFLFVDGRYRPLGTMCQGRQEPHPSIDWIFGFCQDVNLRQEEYVIFAGKKRVFSPYNCHY